jgi:hypothetical protein
MVQKITIGLFRDVLLDIFREILYFPVWWYSIGLGKVFWAVIQSIKSMEMRLGLKIWIVNIFKPMFGQRDIPGKIISFFMRIFQIIIRGIILIIWCILMLSLIIIWIGLPFVIILGIIINLVAK